MYHNDNDSNMQHATSNIGAACFALRATEK